MAANGARIDDDDDAAAAATVAVAAAAATTTAATARASPMRHVRMLRIVMLDYHAIRRTKLVPYCAPDRAPPNALIVKCGVVLMPDCTLPPHCELDVVGEVYMLPYSPHKHPTHAPRHAALPLPLPRVIPWPTHANHSFSMAHLHQSDGKPWPYCPRECLARAVQLLAAQQLTMLAGFEMEFVLLERDPQQPPSLKPFGSAAGYALHSQVDAAANVLDHMVAALAQAHIAVNLVHAEGGPGQFEIVLAHKPLLTAVDDLLTAREIVRSVARSHSLYASFMPKYGAAGSGAHVHFSVAGHFGGSATLYEQHVGMTPLAQHFVAGVLDALPWLTFLTNASVSSYLRLLPQHWVGVYKVWGISNKEAPLRLALDRSNMELKTLDGVSNPYLAMAGLVAAGLNGVRCALQLPPPCAHDPHMTAASKRAERLPASLAESMERFRDAAARGCVRDVMADEVVNALLAAKAAEVAAVERDGLDAVLRKLQALH